MKLSCCAILLLTSSSMAAAATAAFGQQTLINGRGGVADTKKILRQHYFAAGTATTLEQQQFQQRQRHLDEEDEDSNEESEEEEDEDNESEEEEEEDGDGEEEEQEMNNEFLTKYSMKFVSCNPNEVVVNPESGENEYGAVIVRMCESDSCKSNSKMGCKKHYGDIIVSTSTFLKSYVEENYDSDDEADDDENNFELGRYTDCDRYEPPNNNNEEEDGDGEDEEEETYYYIGPACTNNGKDIRLALYEDEYCSTEVSSSTTKFSDISGTGSDLPYSNGGIISNDCLTCLAAQEEEEQNNEEDGDESEEYYDYDDAVNDFCIDVYENSPYKCESKMEFVSYYGADESGCDIIKQQLKSSTGSGGGSVMFWIFFFIILIFCCGYGYTAWWRAKKLRRFREAEGQIL